MLSNMLIHIVPSLPPQDDGAGNYALNLALHLRQTYGVESRFLVCDPEWDGPTRMENFLVRRLRVQNEAGLWCFLASAKEPCPGVLLHYAGTGYNKMGVPIWLYRGIRSWLGERDGEAARNRARFFTVFHDLWSSPTQPWKRGFYTRLMQRWLVRQLHRLSRNSVTMTRRMQLMLDDIQPDKTLFIPTSSKVPTVYRRAPSGLRQDRLRAAIFGCIGSRCATIRSHSNLLRGLSQKNLLANVMLLGTEVKGASYRSDDLELLQQIVPPDRIEALVTVPPNVISEYLNQVDLFLSRHSGKDACKSGSIMAALASGCPVVLREEELTASLNEGEHFITSDDSPNSLNQLERIVSDGRLDAFGVAGRNWYERHADWAILARAFQMVLFGEIRDAMNSGLSQKASMDLVQARQIAKRRSGLANCSPPEASPSSPAVLT